ncbi:5-oxoprolinase subunit PxpA [Idiomarina sp. HP20-50]|uniref:5-oxoprolinase subunit PxpA n=1 Tax=Idiomarina sp. HP20-50 TaxID=3070813 RepID=UPI00294ADF0A|nr:5-oxoprolinase subunit PxpA [Idiomarina sp. HP20-50]MDV6314929.1 5-oxoprolinase subunit PxpA [Idiomarina sp. HP20-50]
MSRRITLNSDIGESFGAWTMGADDLIMPHIDCANVACGFHASDPLTMLKTVKLAKQHNVTIGAHPAYPDLVGFGRRHMALKADEVTALIQYQVGALQGICAGQKTTVSYVKPHGALYGDMLSDGQQFDAVCEAIAALQSDYDTSLPLMVMATPENDAWRSRAKKLDVELWFEGFADRSYDDNGQLRSRSCSDAVHDDNDAIYAQAEAFAKGRPIESVSGKSLQIEIDSLCVHGDNPKTIETVEKLRDIVRQAYE